MFEPRHQIKSAVAGTIDAIGPIGLVAFSGVDLREICSRLWQGKGTIVIATAASLVATLLFVLVVVSIYRGNADSHRSITCMRSITSWRPPSVATPPLQVEPGRVLSSDNVLRRVISTEGLDRDQICRRPIPVARVDGGVLAGSGWVAPSPPVTRLPP